MLDEVLKKKKSDMDPTEKEAKMSAIEEMRKLAASMMKDDLGKHVAGMKQVSVAAPDEESLKEGLDHAKEVIGQHADEGEEHEEEAGEEGAEPYEGEETPAEEEKEVEDMDMSVDEIEEMQRILEEKKQKLLSK